MSDDANHTSPRYVGAERRAEIRVNLAQAAIVIAVLTGLISLTQAWLILPYRMDAAEAKISTLEAKVEVQNTILIRIDEGVKAIKERPTP